ncbi:MULTISPECIES: hypothetical protein [Streptomyces]|nr:hypothetical protein [Streptomyces venezuelae]
MVVGRHVVFPLLYAKRDVPVTAARLRTAYGLRADLIRRHGPEPMQLELDLDLDLHEADQPDPHPDVALLPPELRLVIVAYACSMEQGVIRVEWGSAELHPEDRSLLWHHHEPLLPQAAPRTT